MNECLTKFRPVSTPMTALVAGAAGFVGTNFLHRVAGQPGLRVIAVYREKMPVVQGNNIRLVQADLRDPEQCRHVMTDVDQVFMFAGRLSTAAILKSHPVGPVTDNTVMNLNMLEAAYWGGVKSYVWLSSATGYPSRGTALREDEFFDEDPPFPYEAVGWMSRYVEKLGELYARRSNGRLTVASLRPTGMYGPYDDFKFETCHALPALMRRVLERHAHIEVWGSGEDERDYIFIDDVVDACLIAAQETSGSVALNIGSGQTFSLNQLLEVMLKWESQGHVNVVHRGDVGLPVMRREIDCTKAKEVLKFRAKTSIEQGLRKTMAWYRNARITESSGQVARGLRREKKSFLIPVLGQK